MTLAEVKQELAAARGAYLEIVNTAPAAQVFEASQRVRKAQAALVAALTEGAKPCPDCNTPPHGIEQPTGRRGMEYEVGCLACGSFEHTDGTWRAHRVRGGMIPRHAVDAWNAGPDSWMTAPAPETKA